MCGHPQCWWPCTCNVWCREERSRWSSQQSSLPIAGSAKLMQWSSHPGSNTSVQDAFSFSSLDGVVKWEEGGRLLSAFPERRDVNGLSCFWSWCLVTRWGFLRWPSNNFDLHEGTVDVLHWSQQLFIYLFTIYKLLHLLSVCWTVGTTSALQGSSERGRGILTCPMTSTLLWQVWVQLTQSLRQNTGDLVSMYMHPNIL